MIQIEIEVRQSAYDSWTQKLVGENEDDELKTVTGDGFTEFSILDSEGGSRQTFVLYTNKIVAYSVKETTVETADALAA